MNYSTKKTLSIISITLTLLVTTLMSCDKNGIPESQYEIEFYRQNQLTNIYNNEVSKLVSEFIEFASTLNEVVVEFNQQTTLDNLLVAQQKWEDALLVWKQIELYNIGPIDTSFIYYKINFWPTNTNFINTFINGTDIINNAYIESRGGSSKGLSAIEYLLFKPNNEETLNSFTIDANHQRRLEYLVALSQNLKLTAQNLETLWIDYQTEFTSAVENGLDGSQNLVINQMVALLEEIKIYKLGKPLGEDNGGVIDIDELEAYRSKTSLKIIKQNLIALKRCYTGDFAQTPFRVGFKTFMIQYGYEDLNQNILNRFEACFSKIDAISNPLVDQLNENPEVVSELNNEVTQLLVFIKVDMANVLGSTITFNDNDGD
ncbi:imelysin family protein [Ichthyenterobacterium magnum]|uniref:Putative lipoprotein n=1 Tax=Ichthyenterobacterium magnum TaxID=1230530 RepID=A0A420DMB3_9FLAO|nr:imelysin family protein [Ichthyenterobacterium magnum]RKE95424.1 putative lipoprotein [Ichthyenterobacterium magnum]